MGSSGAWEIVFVACLRNNSIRVIASGSCRIWFCTTGGAAKDLVPVTVEAGETGVGEMVGRGVLVPLLLMDRGGEGARI